MPYPQKISEIKAFQKTQDSIFTTIITRRISRLFTYLILKYDSKATPNKISILSFIMAFFACILITYDNYWLRIGGVLFLQLAFVFDCADGEVARYKNMSTKFGAWFDSVADRMKEALMFSALSYAAFARSSSLYVFLLGALTIISWLMVGYLREAKKSSWPDARKAEFFITKNIYIGTVDVTIFLVCAAVIFKIEFFVLALFLFASFPLLIKQVYSAWKTGQQD